jgi:hypothetical protein
LYAFVVAGGCASRAPDWKISLAEYLTSLDILTSALPAIMRYIG